MLYNSDCILQMRNMIAAGVQVDSVITDPPYSTTQCSWDVVIPFEEMWECLHKLCPRGPIVLFGKQPFTSRLIMSNVSEFRENLVWLKNKSGNGFRATKRHIQVLEDIVVFSSNCNYTFNPQKWLVSDKEFLTQRKTFEESEVGNNIYGKIVRTRREDTGERNPINIVSCKVPFTPSVTKTYGDDVEIRFHPTQKPLDLMSYLVSTYSRPNDLVLDFTMGSGTTGVACTQLGRNFIGIEQNSDYFEKAKLRIESAVKNTDV